MPDRADRAMSCPVAAPSVKQQFAAVRMLFDWLVIGQIVPTNPRRCAGPSMS